MDPSSKSEYFKVIEEQLKDNNVVTFKWLSCKLQIHNSVAKELLQEYLDESDDKNKYIVTLVVYGKKEQGDLLLSLVNESEFTTLKNTISVIDKHIYSIQPAESTFNPDMIYNLDKATYELKQLSLSSIEFNKEIIRKSKSAPVPSTTPATPAKPEPSSTKQEKKSTPAAKEKLEVKKESPKKESPPSKPNKEVNGKPEAKKSIVKPVSNSKGSISSFFQKQATKAAANKTSSTTKNDSPSNQNAPATSDTKEQIHDPSDEEKTEPAEPSSTATKSESPKTNGVSKNLETDTLAEKIDQKSASKKQTKSKSKKSQTKKATKQKKMKRIILQSDSSSEGEASDQEDTHVSEPEPEEEPEPVIESPKKEPPAVIISHGKKRKRKVIDKTVMDDDGYLHTTKEVVYESCSSDENEKEEANNENVDNNKRFKSDENTAEVKTKTNNEEVTKIQTQKTKQASIMSFFKKPTKT